VFQGTGSIAEGGRSSASDPSLATRMAKSIVDGDADEMKLLRTLLLMITLSYVGFLGFKLAVLVDRSTTP
jgi:hypothetical protein